jgi:hypothetical protein
MVGHPRHLPQLRLPESVYCITYRLDARNDSLSPDERTLVAANLEHFNEQRYRLAGYVVMDDHVHVMVMPLDGHELGAILHSWKSYTAKEINKLRASSGTRWMKDSRTEIMRSELETRTKLQYILDNPQRRWPDAADYPWVRLFPVL